MVQRADEARVVVDGAAVGGFESEGLVVYLGVTHEDGLRPWELVDTWRDDTSHSKLLKNPERRRCRSTT